MQPRSSSSVTAWISDIFACMGGCLACCIKPLLIISVDKPEKDQKIQGHGITKKSLLEDISSTSTYEMENSGIQSQRSNSSMGISNLNHDPHSVCGSPSNPSDFVNHGLLLWNQARQQWVGDRKGRSRSKTREPKLSWNATYESLLGTKRPFPQPIPLPEMVDFLVDVWEEEGLYD